MKMVFWSGEMLKCLQYFLYLIVTFDQFAIFAQCLYLCHYLIHVIILCMFKSGMLSANALLFWFGYYGINIDVIKTKLIVTGKSACQHKACL